MAYKYKNRRMSATRRAYLAGVRKGKSIARRARSFRPRRSRRW